MEHAKHDRIHTQALSESRLVRDGGMDAKNRNNRALSAARGREGCGAGHTSRPRTAREGSVRRRTRGSARERSEKLVEPAQDLGETEASHCTGGVSSALAEGD